MINASIKLRLPAKAPYRINNPDLNYSVFNLLCYDVGVN